MMEGTAAEKAAEEAREEGTAAEKGATAEEVAEETAEEGTAAEEAVEEGGGAACGWKLAAVTAARAMRRSCTF